jgi:glycosyltransferase involved in cell wall biosynthesis
MGKKITVGLIYVNDDKWIGGTYYIESIIHAWNTLSLELRPAIRVYCYTPEEFNSLKNKTNYPFLQPDYLIHRNLVVRVINAAYSKIFKKHLFLPRINHQVDIIFPNPVLKQFAGFKKKLFWIPDFQELHYPDFFSAIELQKKKNQQEYITQNNLPLVLSSKSAYNDLKKLSTTSTNAVYVVPFAVTLPDVTQIKVGALFEKFAIEQNYFICSNQFWKHKNHQLVLEALQHLKNKGVDIKVVFTGKPYDYRNPSYYKSILQYVDDHGLSSNVTFLGFIDRKEQLVLMKNSMAILQPSLFEGWSTVVEDAKAMGHSVIVSDISVHREQLGQDYPYFFNPFSCVELASIMELFYRKESKSVLAETDYSVQIRNFGLRLLDVVNKEAAV